MVDLEALEQGACDQPCLVFLLSTGSQSERDVVDGRQVTEQQIVLEHRADASLVGFDEHVGVDVVEHDVVESDTTGFERDESEHTTQDRRLTRPVGTEHGECLSIVHAERHVETEVAPIHLDRCTETHGRVTSCGLPSQRSRKPMSTPNDTTMSTMLRMRAAPGSDSSAM